MITVRSTVLALALAIATAPPELTANPRFSCEGAQCIAQAVSSNTVTEPIYGWNPSTVRQKNSSGRYILFTGFTTITIHAKPERIIDAGNQGTIVCPNRHPVPYDEYYASHMPSDCKIYDHRDPVIEPAEPERLEKKNYRYEIDCLDRTFDRKNDRKPWMHVDADPTAEAAANALCPG